MAQIKFNARHGITVGAHPAVDVFSSNGAGTIDTLTSKTLLVTGTSAAVTITGGSVATTNPVLNLTQTWSGTAGVTDFTGIKLNVTESGSISTAKLIDLQVAGASKFKVDRAGVTTVVDLTVSGNLTINGTTTTINSTTVSVDDKNIELGAVDVPSDTTADGGGITLKGTTDKTIVWTSTTGSWDFNQSIRATGGRPITISGATGTIYIQSDSGGWNNGYWFKGSSGTAYHGFGANGNADTLNHYFIGSDTGTGITVLPAGNVGINRTNPGSYRLNVAGDTFIDGTLYATSKSFKINHPTKANKKLVYGSLEGPENGIYVRGRTTSNVIELPEYWSKLIDESSMTVQLTPISNHQKLYVDRIENNCVYVTNANLINKKIDCYYFIQAERIDVAKLVVESDD